ncbi:MAG: hypothetical protein ABI629_08695 [bacterium]
MRTQLAVVMLLVGALARPVPVLARDPVPEIPSAARRVPGGAAPAPDGAVPGEPANMPLPGDRPAPPLPGGAGGSKPAAQLPINPPGPPPVNPSLPGAAVEP